MRSGALNIKANKLIMSCDYILPESKILVHTRQIPQYIKVSGQMF